MSGEEWRVVSRHAGYEVSSLGRVRNRRTGRILKPGTQSKGYLKVCLGRALQVYIHQLVAEAWHGPAPFGHDVDHVDFDRANNVPSNLRWVPGPDNWTRWQRYVQGEPEDHEPLSSRELEELDPVLERASGW